ncbi:MAG: MarR family winged helix-turn-helix transcriptional regulator [Kofleriaceae bacterium]
MAARVHLSFFDENSEPIDRRIAKALHKLGLAMKHQAWMQANEEGLSPTQAQIIGALAEGGALTVSELAKQLGVTMATVSDSVRVVVAKGFASKKPDPRHPRATLIELTQLGRKLAAKTKTWPEFLSAAVSSLSEPEQQAFNKALLKMIRMMQEAGQIPVSKMCITCTSFRPNVHDGPAPHHCALVDAPLADHHLRLDCPEHTEAAKPERDANWLAFIAQP